LIRDHAFNSHWWGCPVGVVYDAGFFSLDLATQKTLLKPYVWVEFSSQLDQAPPRHQLSAAGFTQTDTQIEFLLNLNQVKASTSTARLSNNFADQKNFHIKAETLTAFSHERFQHIPGYTATRANARYALWANRLIHEHPETCLTLFLDNRLQGWFLSRPGKQGHLNLVLAMLSNTAEISGMLLYQQACVAYAARGHRLGSASFSVTNTPVHNIYAALGARFMPPSGNWLWLSPSTGNQTDD